MKIDLTDAMAVEFSDWHAQVPLDMTSVSFVQGDFPIEEKSPVQICVQYEKEGQMQLTAKTEISVAVPCDRCLKPVSCRLSVEAKRDLDLSGKEQPSYIEGSLLDVDGLIFHELLLQWPAKILCREDCRGLCPVCGADLNCGECGCDRHVLDPRMAAIQDVFNKFQSK